MQTEAPLRQHPAEEAKELGQLVEGAQLSLESGCHGSFLPLTFPYPNSGPESII